MSKGNDPKLNWIFLPTDSSFNQIFLEQTVPMTSKFEQDQKVVDWSDLW